MRAAQSGRAVATASAFPLLWQMRWEFRSAALVDREMDMVVVPGRLDALAMKAEAKANARLVAAVAAVLQWLRLEDEIEEIEVRTSRRIDVIQLLDSRATMFLYVSLNAAEASSPEVARRRVDQVRLAFGV